MSRVRIKLGAKVFVDFGCYEWPKVKYASLDIVFDIRGKINDGYLDLIADNFGRFDGQGYGNGSVVVREQDTIAI